MECALTCLSALSLAHSSNSPTQVHDVDNRLDAIKRMLQAQVKEMALAHAKLMHVPVMVLDSDLARKLSITSSVKA